MLLAKNMMAKGLFNRERMYNNMVVTMYRMGSPDHYIYMCVCVCVCVCGKQSYFASALGNRKFSTSLEVGGERGLNLIIKK